MAGYKAAIMQATGAPFDDLAILEGIMREVSGGALDSLTPGEFNAAAKEARDGLEQLRRDEEDDLIEHFRQAGS